ncbi:DUF1631 domain-containing protein [Methylomagnum sp.]
MTTQHTDDVSAGIHTPRPMNESLASRGPIIAEVRAIYAKSLAESLHKLLAIVDDELFKRSEKAESSVQQSLYFGAMRHFRVQAGELQSSIQWQLAQGYEKFWRSHHAPVFALGPADNLAQGDDPGFSLVENEVLEEEIAITAMVEKGNNLFQDALHGLNKRFAFLLGREDVSLDENPLAPKAICQAFAIALKPISSEIIITLLVYKLFDHVVLNALGELYLELNGALVNEGILPSLPKGVRRASSLEAGIHNRATAGGKAPADREGSVSEDNQQAYIEVFQGLQQLLAGWRAQVGIPVSDLPAGPVVDARTVLNALSLLQAPGAGLMAGAEGLKPCIADQLHKLQPGEDGRMGRSEEDIIDMVALIFDFILEDQHMPDVVKGLIARLQIPVVKVAIIEKSFFGRKNHPVRLLLNALAQAGTGIGSDQEAIASPAYKKIESVVTRILDEFDQNVGLFSDLLDEFMAFLEKDDQRTRVVEERARQTIQSKEQVHLAKRKIAYEIANRLHGKPAPTAVRAFLYNAWKDVLVLAYLRREKQPGEWEMALKVMDKLIWSVLPPADETMRRAIIQTIPRLLQAIRAGLEGISMDPTTVTQIIKGLEACHLARLPASMAASHASGAVAEPMAAVAHAETEAEAIIEIRDPEFAQAFNEIRMNLPDVENISAKDLARTEENWGKRKSRHDLVVQGEALFKARDMEIGQWLEFDDGKAKFKGKLSWKSEVTSTYVFINKKGAIVLEITLSDLARRLQDNTAKVVKDIGIPLLDRAFNALINQLKTPVAKPV